MWQDHEKKVPKAKGPPWIPWIEEAGHLFGFVFLNFRHKDHRYPSYSERDSLIWRQLTETVMFQLAALLVDAVYHTANLLQALFRNSRKSCNYRLHEHISVDERCIFNLERISILGKIVCAQQWNNRDIVAISSQDVTRRDGRLITLYLITSLQRSRTENIFLPE